MTEGREPPPERGLFARIAVDIRPLRESRDFRRLWFGTGISAIGSQITAVAIPFQLYELTGSTLLVGMLGIAALVPLLVVPIYGGAVADAVDRRRMLLLSDVALLLEVAGAPEIGNVEAGIVASLTSVRASIVSGGVLTVVGTAVVAALLPALVRYDARRPQDE